jgi:hypothetical protein
VRNIGAVAWFSYTFGCTCLPGSTLTLQVNVRLRFIKVFCHISKIAVVARSCVMDEYVDLAGFRKRNSCLNQSLEIPQLSDIGLNQHCLAATFFD